ncbi:MAG: putative membrane protein [Saprospiraceae bacterium]|jgi:uncharacterized membrane protein
MRTEKTTFLLGKKNLRTIGIGFLIIVLGFMLMAGGESASPDEFEPTEIFSTQRITIAPITVILGFLVVGIGVMIRPEKTLVEENDNDQVQ